VCTLAHFCGLLLLACVKTPTLYFSYQSQLPAMPTRTLQLLIEVEVDESTEITPELIKSTWGQQSNYHEMVMDPEWLEALASERVMLAALRANPVAYAEYMRANTISRLEGLSGQEIFALGNLHRQDYEVLKDLVPSLPEGPAKAYYTEAIRDDWFWNTHGFISECFRFEFKRISLVGEPIAPIAESPQSE
jgi:hypothetical protein